MTTEPRTGSNGTAEPKTPGGSGERGRSGGVVKRIIALLATGLALYVLLPSLAKVFDAWPKLVILSAVWLVVATAGLAGNAVTNTLPGGDAAGAAVQFRMLSAAGVKTDTAAGRLAASSLLSVGGLLAVPILTLPAVLGVSGVNHALIAAALVGVAGFGIYVGLGAVLLGTERPLYSWRPGRRRGEPQRAAGPCRR